MPVAWGAARDRGSCSARSTGRAAWAKGCAARAPRTTRPIRTAIDRPEVQAERERRDEELGCIEASNELPARQLWRHMAKTRQPGGSLEAARKPKRAATGAAPTIRIQIFFFNDGIAS